MQHALSVGARIISEERGRLPLVESSIAASVSRERIESTEDRRLRRSLANEVIQFINV